MRKTFTGFFCCIPCTLPIACKSRFWFQSCSKKMAVCAADTFKPWLLHWLSAIAVVHGLHAGVQQHSLKKIQASMCICSREQRTTAASARSNVRQLCPNTMAFLLGDCRTDSRRQVHLAALASDPPARRIHTAQLDSHMQHHHPPHELGLLLRQNLLDDLQSQATNGSRAAGKVECCKNMFAFGRDWFDKHSSMHVAH